MRNTTTLISCVVLCLLVGGCKSEGVAQDAEAVSNDIVQDLVEKSIAAQGGLENLRAVESMRSTAEAHIPSLGITTEMVVYQKRPALMWLLAKSPNGEVIEAYDGERAWTDNPIQGGVQLFTEEQSRHAKEQADLDGFLVGFEAKGYSMTYAGEDEVRGMKTKKLLVTRPDSSEVILHLNADTFLQAKREDWATNPENGDKVKVEFYMMDYRDVGGVMRPFQTEVMMDNNLFQTLKIKEIQINVAVEDTLFTYPDSINIKAGVFRSAQ